MRYKLRELLENAIPGPLAVCLSPASAQALAVCPATAPVAGPRWLLKGADGTVVAFVKASTERDAAVAKLLAHAYNHFPELLEVADEALHDCRGNRVRLKAALAAANAVDTL
jgi:hypothetical protein